MTLRVSDFVHQINIDALEEAIGFEPVEQVGDEDRGYCPLPWGLHKNGDTTGKFSINREKRVYGCWVCGGGSLLSLAMAVKDLDPDEATDWLHQFAGLERDTDLLERVQQIFADGPTAQMAMPYYNEQVLEKWAAPDHPWFKKRGISEDAAVRYKLGYSDEMVRYAPKVGGERVEDPYMGPAIVLPHYWRGRLVGWQCRWLEDDRPKWVNKYTNTPDFPKRETLFNYDAASLADAIPIVVESVPTALFLISQGYSTICTFGASITTEQLMYLRRFQQGVAFAPDNDSAGEIGLEKAEAYLKPYIPVKVILPPMGQGADLGDLASDPKQLNNLLESAIYGISKVHENRAQHCRQP